MINQDEVLSYGPDAAGYTGEASCTADEDAVLVLVHVSVQQGCPAGPGGSGMHRWHRQLTPPPPAPGLPSLCAGIYTFTLKDGTKVPARFSYVFVKRDGKW